MKKSDTPAGKPRSTDEELKAYNQHVKHLKHPFKKVDDEAPYLPAGRYLGSGKLAADAKLVDMWHEKNIQLLQKINMIYRTQGKVDCHYTPGIQKTNYIHRINNNKKIELHNKVIYDLFNRAMSQYQTSKLLKEFEKNKQSMMFMSEHPEYYEEKVTELDSWSIVPPNVDQALLAPTKRKRVFFDFEIEGDRKLGRMFIEVYNDIVPKTADKFLQYCDPNNKKTYKGKILHRIVPDLICLGGDVEKNNGLGAICERSDFFPNENFTLKFNGPGVISTYTICPKRNNAIFLITFKKLETLNKKFVVFGRVIKSLRVLQMIEEFGTKSGKPLSKVVIANCGIFKT